jgi:hypothetical protein
MRCSTAILLAQGDINIFATDVSVERWGGHHRYLSRCRLVLNDESYNSNRHTTSGDVPCCGQLMANVLSNP